ncbi:30S ribosomal protein S16 [Patescibacteria group bacterium]|nr:30S ribosomal protein S16 [Patescibacteria group bacterium]
MSVTIRLSRTGRKNQPTYKLVVANTRDKRNGRYIEVLGYYNPFDPKQKFSYDKDKFEKWKSNGALVTDAVNKLINGTYEYVKYEPKKAAGKEVEATKDEKPAEKEDKKPTEVKEEEAETTEEPSEPEITEEPKEEEKGE